MLNLMLLIQDTEPAAAGGTTLTTILALVVPVLGIAITMFLIPWLRTQGRKAEAEAKKADLEAGATLFERVKGYVFRRVADLIEEEYPRIATDVVAGTLTQEAIKERLYAIGANLKTEVIDYFRGQGVDLVKDLGDAALDALIRSAANQLSPFPGKSTAVALGTSAISNVIVDRGVDWAAKTFLTDDSPNR